MGVGFTFVYGKNKKQDRKCIERRERNFLHSTSAPSCVFSPLRAGLSSAVRRADVSLLGVPEVSPPFS